LASVKDFIPIPSRRNGGAQRALYDANRQKLASLPAARASPKIPSRILGQSNFLGEASVGADILALLAICALQLASRLTPSALGAFAAFASTRGHAELGSDIVETPHRNADPRDPAPIGVALQTPFTVMLEQRPPAPGCAARDASTRHFGPPGGELFLNQTYLASPPDPLRLRSEFQISLVRRQAERGFLTDMFAGRQE